MKRNTTDIFKIDGLTMFRVIGMPITLYVKEQRKFLDFPTFFALSRAVMCKASFIHENINLLHNQKECVLQLSDSIVKIDRKLFESVLKEFKFQLE